MGNSFRPEIQYFSDLPCSDTIDITVSRYPDGKERTNSFTLGLALGSLRDWVGAGALKSVQLQKEQTDAFLPIESKHIQIYVYTYSNSPRLGQWISISNYLYTYIIYYNPIIFCFDLNILSAHKKYSWFVCVCVWFSSQIFRLPFSQSLSATWCTQCFAV
jgi:hypothetical protein